MPIREIEKLIAEEAGRLRTMLAGTNRREVAKAIGLHPNTIYEFVKGSDVALPTLRKIAEHLDDQS